MIRESQLLTCADPDVTNDVMTNVLSRSFLTARLLTGNNAAAEKAVMQAITVWNPDIDDEEQVFQNTLRTAVQLQTAVDLAISNENATGDELPIELRRVLDLSPEHRSSFVLRLLVGLPSHVCAQILGLDISQLNQNCCEAVRHLGTLGSFRESQLPASCIQR